MKSNLLYRIAALALCLCAAAGLLTACGGKGEATAPYSGADSTAESAPTAVTLPRLTKYTAADAEAAMARRSGTAEYTLRGETLTETDAEQQLDAFFAQYEEPLWNQEAIPKAVRLRFADIPELEMLAEIYVEGGYSTPNDTCPVMDARVREITFHGKTYKLYQDFRGEEFAAARLSAWEPNWSVMISEEWVIWQSNYKAMVFYNGGCCRMVNDAEYGPTPTGNWNSASIYFERDDSGRLLCGRTMTEDFYEIEAYYYKLGAMPEDAVLETVSVLTVENGELKETPVKTYTTEEWIRKYMGSSYEKDLKAYNCSNYLELAQALKEERGL